MTNDRDRTQPLIDPGAGREETSHTSGGLVATAFGLTDVGVQRSVNQDTLGNRVAQHADRAMAMGLLYAVADGMGGHARGEVASALAIQHLFARYYNGDAGEDPKRGLERVLLETNAAVHQAGRDAGGAAMGTTLTLALLRDEALYVGNIGDSRTYRIRNGQIEQLTHDHSLIGEQVRSGLLTENQARQSSIRNVITRAVGYREEVEADVFTYPVQAGDIILLCSDGLHSMVDSQELVQHFSTQPLGAAVPALIDLAKQRGGPDNITALAVRIDAVASSATSLDDAKTLPMTAALNDAVTKPFVRADEEATASETSGGAAVATATAPLPQPPAPPPAAPAQPAMVPAQPAPVVPPPPATRPSSSRFPIALLILPLLLLAVVAGGIVAVRSLNGGDEPTATVAAAASSAGPSIAAVGSGPGLPPAPSGPPSAQPGTSSGPSVSSIGAAVPTPTTSPRTNTTPIQPILTPAPSAAASAAPVSVTIVSGTATVNGPVAPNAEWDIVVFRASDLPAELPPANQLSGYATSWSVRIAPQNGQAVPYEVTGEWKSATAEDRVLIVLRSTMGSQVAYFYPAGGTPELTTVNQNSALPGSTLTFELPRP